jgi:hypothetical protein
MAANVDWASSAEEQEKLIAKVSDVTVQHGTDTEYCTILIVYGHSVASVKRVEMLRIMSLQALNILGHN